MTSRIIQHEVDHLEGITFLQKANKYHIEQAKKALKKVQRIRKRNESEDLPKVLKTKLSGVIALGRFLF